MKFEPRNNNLLVKPSEAATVSKGGIYIPDNVQQQESKGIVVSVGDGCRNLHIGYLVAYSRYGGTEIDIDKVKHVVLKDDDILGVWCK